MRKLRVGEYLQCVSHSEGDRALDGVSPKTRIATVPKAQPEEANSTPRPGSSGAEDLHALRKIEVLEPLADKDIEDLLRRLPTFRFEKGNILFTPRNRANLSYFLLEGSVRIYKACENDELTLELVHAGGMFSNSGAGNSSVEESGSVGGLRLGVYAQALRPARIAMIRHEHFRRLATEHPEVSFRAMAVLERRLSLYGERMFDMAAREVPSRLARLLLSLMEDEGVVDKEGIKLPVSYTHEELATMVGSKRVAITRAFGELKRSGVETRRRQIRITNLPALKQAAG